VLTATEVASPAPEQRMMIQPVYTRAAGGGPDRLTRYYVNHTEYAPPLSGRGALTRIIVIQPEAADAEAERRPRSCRWPWRSAGTPDECGAGRPGFCMLDPLLPPACRGLRQ
jgi:hypothetical protein